VRYSSGRLSTSTRPWLAGSLRDGEPQGEEKTIKFFTRDLYRRCRSTDEAILNAACEEWEQANAAYERHLSAIEPEFPPHLREFAELLLHDARIQSIARRGNQLILVLHKDIPPRDLVILSYELVGELIVEPFADAPADWSRPTTFQFDELDIVDEGESKIYSESIVFGNGVLLRLRFRDVRVTVAQSMYPAAVSGSLPAIAIPHPI
jgi:hypothetical protein